MQTVEPLAARLGIPVEAHPALSEEADVTATWELLEGLATTESALCTHGNILDAVIDRLHRRGVELVGRRGSGRKASVWSVHVSDGTFLRAVHAPPPQV